MSQLLIEIQHALIWWGLMDNLQPLPEQQLIFL